MTPTETSEPWLPDLCRRPRLLALLGMSQLVVVLVALWPDSGLRTGVMQFLSMCGFAMWLAIAVAILLCKSRAPLSRLRPTLGIALVLVLTALMVMFASGTVYGLYAAIGQSPFNVGFWRFTLSCSAISVLIAALALRYFYVSDRWAAQLNASARAEADALQARIRPHFLFNSMNLIASLVRRDPAVAERAVLDLSDLFRAALGAGDGTSTLRQEVELAKRYLSIESLRLGDRLQVEWALGEPLPWDLPMPHLVLQPLVENAILHGISRVPEGGRLLLDLHAEGGLLHILIENPAPAPGAAVLALQKGAGHAQRNIAHRLDYQFQSRAGLAGVWQDGTYRCRMMVPLG